MYCNVYVPQLQREGGVAAFFRHHRGFPFASSALMDPISKALVAAIHAFVRTEGVPLITFPADRRKEDVAAAYRAAFPHEEGVVVIGRAQEKTPVSRTQKRRNPRTGTYPWLVRSTAMDVLPVHGQALPQRARVREAPTRPGRPSRISR